MVRLQIELVLSPYLSSVMRTASLWMVLIPSTTVASGQVLSERQQSRILSSFF